MRTWSTRGVRETERFSCWREVVCDALVPVRIARDREGAFFGKAAALTVGAMGVVAVASERQVWSRTPELVERAPSGRFLLSLALGGGSAARQGGRVASLRAGDFTVVDGDRPFELRFDGPFRQVLLAIPAAMLEQALTSPAEVTALRVPGDGGVGAVAAASIRQVAAQRRSVEEPEARALDRCIVALVALSLRRVAGPLARSRRALLAQEVFDEIERRLAEPDLSPGSVAACLGLSTRALQKLFAERGTTFGAFVLRRRLDECHAQLADPGTRGQPVAELAARLGLADPSHFSRVFKSRYGLTPTEVRRTGLAG